MLNEALSFSLMGAGTALVSRLMQHLVPTPLERAQLESLSENLRMARERLASEEARTRQEWEVRESLVIRQIEAHTRDHIDGFEMQRWPLGVPAGALNRHSISKGGGALNVLVYRGPVCPTPGLDKDSEQRILQDLELAARRLESSTSRYFGRDVTFYNEISFGPELKRQISGQQAVAAIASLTRTQPFLLIDVSIQSATHIGFAVSCWGWQLGASDDAGSGISHLCFELKEPGKAAADLENAVLLLVGMISDQFQLVRRLAKPPTSSIWAMEKSLDGLTFSAQGHGPYPDLEQTAKQIVKNTRLTTINEVARRSEILAAEIAAKYSVDAFQADDKELAQEFLELAGSLYRRHLDTSDCDLDDIASELRKGRESWYFTRAYGLSIGESKYAVAETGPEPKVDPYLLFEEKLAAASPEVQKIIRRKIKEIIDYSPTVAIFGKAGVGKSSICNSLFGRDAFHVSPVDEGTTEAQTGSVHFGDGEFKLV